MWLALYFFGQYCFIYIHLYISQVHWNQSKTAYSPHCLLSPKVLFLLLYSLSQWIVLFILPKPEILESTLVLPSPMSLISISCSLFVLFSISQFHVLLPIVTIITWKKSICSFMASWFLSHLDLFYSII